MAALFIPIDGRLTSQNVLNPPLTGGEVMYIVSPGNVAQGSSYQITTLSLASFFNSYYTINPTIITTGPGYGSFATDVRILIDLTVAGALAIALLPSGDYLQPILIKDIGGTVSESNLVTITFSNGQSADGQTSITLRDAYAGIWLNPLSNGGFYLTAA